MNTASQRATRGIKITVLKQITAQQIKLENNITYVLRLDTPFFRAKDAVKSTKREVDDAGNLMPAQQPPMLCRVTDVTGGLPGVKGEIIVPAVMQIEITDEHPNDTYVGKYFSLIKHRDLTKKYNTFTIAEVSVSEADYDSETGEVFDDEEFVEEAAKPAAKKARAK
jgi:hypothetical protein